MAKKTLFPGYRHGPNGECKYFESEDQVPDGWHRNSPEGLRKRGELPDEEVEGDEGEVNIDAMLRPELEALAEKRKLDPASIKGTGANDAVLVDDLRDALKAQQEARD